MIFTKLNYGNIMIEDAIISSKDFEGTRFGPNSRKTFCIRIDDAELANELIANEVDVRISTPKNDTENREPYYFLPVEVRFDKYPPNVYMHTSKSVVELFDDTVKCLDKHRFSKVDVILNLSRKKTDGRLKAYVRTMHVLIQENPLDEKWASLECPSEPAGAEKPLPF